MSNDAVVIVNGARTAMGGFQGALAPMSAPQLGAASIREAAGWVMDRRSAATDNCPCSSMAWISRR